MKHRNISFIELHVEKLIALLFFVILVVVLVMQAFMSNAVELDGRSVGVDEVSSTLDRQAKSLASAMDGDYQIAEPLPTAVDGSAAWERELAKLQSPSPLRAQQQTVALWNGQQSALVPAEVAEQDQDSTTLPEFAPFTPPAPSAVSAAVFSGTLDPIYVATYEEELQGVLGPGQPYDTRYVTVQAAIDPLEVVRRLNGTHGADGNKPVMPSAWWADTVEIVDVVLERERLLADGTWGERSEVASMPGTSLLRDLARKGDQPAGSVSELIEVEKRNRETVRRASLPPLIAGDTWVPPVALEGLPDAQERAVEAQQLAREIVSLSRSLERMQPREGNRDRSSRRPSDRSSRRPSDRRPSQEQDRDSAAEEERRQRIAELEAEIKRVQQSLEAIGYTFDTETNELVEDQDFESNFLKDINTDTGNDQSLVVSADGDLIQLWAHDLSAEPGESYRYRVRVWTTNPLHTYRRSLQESQRDQAAFRGVEGEPSSWSDTVAVAPMTQYFVRSASIGSASFTGGSIETASVELEVFDYYYGAWRSASVRLDAGDALNAVVGLLPQHRVRLFGLSTDSNGVITVTDPVGDAAVSDTPNPVRPSEGGAAGEEIEVEPGVLTEYALALPDTLLHVLKAGNAALGNVFFAGPDGVRQLVVTSENDAQITLMRSLVSRSENAEPVQVPSYQGPQAMSPMGAGGFGETPGGFPRP